MIDLSFEQFVAFLPGFLIRLTDKLKPYTGEWTRVVPLFLGMCMMVFGYFAFESSDTPFLLFVLYGLFLGYSAIYAYDQAKKSADNNKTKTLFAKKTAGATKKKTEI